MRLYSCHFGFAPRFQVLALVIGGMLTAAGASLAQDSGTVTNSDASNRVYNAQNRGTTRQQDRPAVSKPPCVWVNKTDGTRIRVCGAVQRKSVIGN
jgi:hypothetical protein